MRRGKKILAIMLTLVFLVGTISIGTETAVASVVKKIDRSYDIAVVFDNSGSMYKSDAWCKAKYAMEIFAAMMPYNKNDSFRIYPMWGVGEKGADKGSIAPMEISSSDDIQKIHDMYTIKAGDTPFEPAREAYADLSKSNADEKWLIVLTDGAFNMDKRDGERKKDIVDVQKELANYASSGDVKVQYLALGDEATAITPDESIDLYSTKTTSDTISTDLINICNRIFKRAKLPDKYFSDNGKLDLDMSMSNVIVFAQGKGAKIKGLEGAKGDVAIKENNKCQFSDVSTGGKYAKTAEVDNTLYGQVVRFGSCKKGKYKLNLKNVDRDKVQIFYEPDVNIKVTLKDPSKNDDKGKELTSTDSFQTGKYTIDYRLIDNKTDDDVSNSELLGKVVYDGKLVYSNGDEKALKQGDPFTLEPDGEAFVKVSARYLDDYVISTDAMKDAYTIKVGKKDAKKIKVELDVLQKGEWYNIKKHDEWQPIRANLKLNGKALTDEQLENVKLDCDFDGKQMNYRTEPVSGQSAVDIYLGENKDGKYTEPEKGKYKVTASASYSDKYHKKSTETDKTKFQVANYPKLIWWLIRIIPLLLLLLFLLWLLLHKAFPKKVYFNDKRGASKIKVKSKAVNLSSNAYPSELTCDAEKVTRFVGKGKKSAKFAIKNINPDPSVQSFSIGVGKEFVRDGTGQFVDTFGTPLSNKTKLTIRNGTEITWRKAGKKRTGTITINSKKK